MLRWLVRLFMLAVLAAAGAAAAVAWWLQAPLNLRQPVVEVSIEPGSSPMRVARLWVEAGVQTEPRWLYEWFRWSGQARQIRAGSYEVHAGVTPRELLRKMVDGDEVLVSVRIIEGWTFRQVRQALEQADGLQLKTRGMSDEQLMQAIGAPGVHPEGRFFPDTYAFSRGVSDLTILRRAYAAMERELAAAWEMRAPDLPLASPDEVLKLASIIEKETGHPDDRGEVAGVFTNRLRIGMRLQTDPTIIYGLGDQFDGRLRRIHLDTDGPYNTYTRAGLPPTPIAMPGRASLRAAVQPADTRAMYFVSRGDGTSEFSRTLQEHNRAVRRYILGRP